MTDDTPVVVQVPAALVLGYMEVRPRAMGIDADWSQTVEILGVRDYFGTERVDGDSRKFDQRITRCYELALHALVLGDFPSTGYLVHGSIHGPFEDNVRIGHAWLRVRLASGINLVWEPTTRLVHLQDEWEKAARAQEQYAYDMPTARRLMLAHDHYGPWAELRYR